MPGQSGDPTAEQVAVDTAAVVSRLMRRLRTASPETRLTPSQRSLLSRLGGEGPATTAALARAEYVRPQSMRLTIGVLEEQGLVERTPDPSDGRQSVVSITEAGAGTLAGVQAAKRDWLTEVIASELNGAERRTLAEATALLRRLIEK